MSCENVCLYGEIRMNVKKIVPKSALNIKLDFGYISFEIYLCGNFEGGLMEDVYIMGRWCLPFEFAVYSCCTM